MLQGLGPAHCALYVGGFEELWDNSAPLLPLGGNQLSMEAGRDAEGQCWVLTCEVWLGRSFLVAAVAVDLSAQPVAVGRWAGLQRAGFHVAGSGKQAWRALVNTARASALD